MLEVGEVSDNVCHSLEGVGQDVNQARAWGLIIKIYSGLQVACKLLAL